MRIVLRHPGADRWTVVQSALYRADDELQQLLAGSPSLVPVADMRPDVTELLLAVREFQIPGSGYQDLLGFSASGDVVLIECKLRANPEIKREVIGQQFEYAGFLWEMTFDDLDHRIRNSHNGQGLTELMTQAVEEAEWDGTTFRQTVARRLESGAFIVVIVVDKHSLLEQVSRTRSHLGATLISDREVKPIRVAGT
jgi:hypothetical protein